MMPSNKWSFRGSSRFQAGCLACSFTGLALCASAQFEPIQNASSMEAFGGNPDSYKFITIPSDTGDWTRHFRIGAMVGLNISANFSEKGTFNISGNNSANGIYDDGYVRPDQSGDPKYTSYWGYNKSSQYDAAAQTLTMHSTTSYSMVGSSKDDGGPSPGFDMAYGDNIWYWKHARVGWEVGFSLLPLTIKDNHSQSASVNQTDYKYSTSGIFLFPDAPYQAGSSGNSVYILSSPDTNTAPAAFFFFPTRHIRPAAAETACIFFLHQTLFSSLPQAAWSLARANWTRFFIPSDLALRFTGI
jgi:hypothetical protein